VALSRSRVVATSIPTVVLALGVGSTAVRTPEADARVSISALTVVDGSVLTSHGGADFAPAREGDVIVAATRSAPGERRGRDHLLRRIECSPRSERGDDRRESAHIWRWRWQALGRAWHVVTTLFSGGSRYERRGHARQPRCGDRGHM